MDDNTRNKVQNLLLNNEGIKRMSASIVSTSIITKTSLDDVLAEAIILIKAQIESAKDSGVIDRLTQINKGMDAFWEALHEKD